MTNITIVVTKLTFAMTEIIKAVTELTFPMASLTFRMTELINLVTQITFLRFLDVCNG